MREGVVRLRALGLWLRPPPSIPFPEVERELLVGDYDDLSRDDEIGGDSDSSVCHVDGDDSDAVFDCEDAEE